jgi:hypothetical protein
MSDKFFSNRSIGLATYLGGPFAGGILISINLKRNEEVNKAIWTLIISLMATIAMFLIIIEIPEEIIDKIPNVIIPMIYTPLILMAAKYLQGSHIEETLKEKENREPWWKALVIGLVGTAVALVIILVISVGQPLFPGEKITYGAVKNEIYKSENTERRIADFMYSRLHDMGYFDDEFAQQAYLEKAEGYYKIVLYVDQSYWEEPDVVSSLTAFKWSMETETGETILLYMRHADLAGEKDKLLE